MPRLNVLSSGAEYTYEAGGTLLEILLANDIVVDNPCNGKGICGKCRVRILSGDVPEITATEKQRIKTDDLAHGVRLSCLVKPKGDLTIELLQRERRHEILAGGYMPKFSFAPAATDGRCGVAIDIGTTTVVCALIDRRTGKELAAASGINAQKRFGLDVLTRITYELEHPEDGVQNLQKAIVGLINEMIGDTCRQAGIFKEEIGEITVGANCTMMHMLLGVDAVPLGKAPYRPAFVRAMDIPAAEIGVEAAEGARIYCLPAVSAYIGADIVAGAYVCGLQKEKGNVLFADIGTNGEIVLSVRGRLLCCSCAAGPALEGMNISSGMRAAEGAVEDVRITEDGVRLKVIGDTEPAGICGSGILAAVKELLRVGLVRKGGAFIKPAQLPPDDYRYPMLRENGKKREFVFGGSAEKLRITQGDIRQVQLAKGAIRSGFLALLKAAGIGMKDLDRVLVAGQFGAHLPADSLTGTGILPEDVGDKLVYVGNTSKTGAYMALMSVTVRREMEELARSMDYVELGATDGYERLFSQCLLFPDVSGRQ